MFATHALVMNGWGVRVFTKVVRKSEMFGAQYLHKPIPGLTERGPSVLEYRLRGNEKDYRAKVYGNTPVPFTSPESLAGKHEAWDIREAYGNAWERYSELVVPIGDISGETLSGLMRDYRPRRIFSAIPAPALCVRTHGFRSRQVWAVGDAPERGIFCPVRVSPMTVECNGEENPRWYRASNVFSYATAEWPDGSAPPVSGVSKINKPIDTDCNCWLSTRGFQRLGRYGAWKKGVLSHQAFDDVMAVL